MISYADFVTLLFAVFVVLFAFSWHSRQGLRSISGAIHSGFESLSINAPQDGSRTELPPAAPVRELPGNQATPLDKAELAREIQGVLGDAISRQEIVMQQTPDGLIISLRELGFFNSGEAKLLPGAVDKLKRTARVLMRHGLQVRVEGHSDNQPIHNAFFRSNWELSTARAMSVLSMLVDDAGFPAYTISVAGYGPYRPVASNATPQGRRVNRRVDLVVISPAPSEAPPL